MPIPPTKILVSHIQAFHHKLNLIWGNMDQAHINIVEVREDAEFESVFDIRHEVFQDEQQVPEETEVDGNDHVAHHYLAAVNDAFVGTGRWRMSLGGNVRMERLAVLKDFRHHGVGRALMERMLNVIPRDREVYLHAPVDACAFYEKLGFQKRGEQFEEAGMQHIEMFLP
jgi:predicted GNAT family N-acyltransferase